MLLGRSQETKYLENCFQKEGNQMIVLYGRENVGKTSLMLDFCQDKVYSYYKARACSEGEQLHLWSEEIRKDYPSVRVQPDFSSIFGAITSQESSKKVLLVDEFQNIVKYSSHFMEEVIKLVHNVGNNQPVMIILCSSSIGWVENAMVSKMGTAAYEITGFLKVKELGFLDLVRRFPKYSVEQCIELYSVLGGVPGLWRHFNPKLSIKENICRMVLKSGSVLSQEAERYVSEELRETSVYHTILETIGAGYNKLNDLYQNTGYSRAKISVYLKNLMELEIVEKVYSIETAGKDNAKCGLYRIKNQFVYFWFRFVFPNLSKLELMSEEVFYNKYIAKELRDFTSETFVEVCTEYLDLLNQTGKLEVRYHKSGRWVGKAGTIDILTEGDDDRRIAGLCSWKKEIMTYEDYEWLIYCAKQARVQVDCFYLFSVGKFDERLLAHAAGQDNIHLVDLSQL